MATFAFDLAVGAQLAVFVAGWALDRGGAWYCGLALTRARPCWTNRTGYEDHLAGDDACAAGHAHPFYRAICQGFLLHRETIEAIALIGSLAEAFTARARALIRRRTNLDRTARRLCPGLAVGLSG